MNSMSYFLAQQNQKQPQLTSSSVERMPGMPQLAAPHVRLRFKQPCPPSAQGAKHIPLQHLRPKKSIRKAAILEGIVPKARRPFALFLQERSQVSKGSARQDFIDEMKSLGRAWKALAASEKASYKQRCQKEFVEQRGAMKARGLPVRRAAAQESVQPQMPEPPQPPQPPDAESTVITELGGFKVIQGREPLGEGSYGCVLASIGPQGCFGATKVYKCNKGMADFQQEVHVFKLLEEKLEPHCRRFFPSYYTSDDRRKPFPFVVLEYGGPSALQVLRRFGPFDENSLKCFALQLKAALQALHRLCVLHLDLKPGNILWSPETFQLKLTDFGMSELEGVEAAMLRFSEYVTEPYRPPELWEASRQEISRHLRPSIDVWSYGCVLYECATGRWLMRPCPEAPSCRGAVRAWCSSWKLLSSKSVKVSKLPEPAKSICLRLSQANCWQVAIRNCLNPNPLLRQL